MNLAFDFELESNINQSDSNFHTAIKPYSASSLTRTNISIEKQTPSFFLNKIIDKSYSKKNGLFIVPLISAFGTAQLENKGKLLTDYGAGAYLKGFIGEKFTYSGFYRYVGSNQPSYIDSSLFSQEVISSVGRARGKS